MTNAETDAELAAQSRLPLYESSDDEDVASIVSHEQYLRVNNLMLERHLDDNSKCMLRRREGDTTSLTPNLRAHIERLDLPAFRASHVKQSRVVLRRIHEILEVMPNWFTIRSSVQSWADCEKLIDFLKRQHGGTWPSRVKRFCVRHPLPCVDTTPMLQNMRGEDFMYVSLLHALKHANASYQDCSECVDKVSSKFKDIVKDTFWLRSPV